MTRIPDELQKEAMMSAAMQGIKHFGRGMVAPAKKMFGGLQKATGLGQQAVGAVTNNAGLYNKGINMVDKGQRLRDANGFIKGVMPGNGNPLSYSAGRLAGGLTMGAGLFNAPFTLSRYAGAGSVDPNLVKNHAMAAGQDQVTNRMNHFASMPLMDRFKYNPYDGMENNQDVQGLMSRLSEHNGAAPGLMSYLKPFLTGGSAEGPISQAIDHPFMRAVSQHYTDSGFGKQGSNKEAMSLLRGAAKGVSNSFNNYVRPAWNAGAEANALSKTTTEVKLNNLLARVFGQKGNPMAHNSETLAKMFDNEKKMKSLTSVGPKGPSSALTIPGQIPAESANSPINALLARMAYKTRRNAPAAAMVGIGAGAVAAPAYAGYGWAKELVGNDKQAMALARKGLQWAGQKAMPAISNSFNNYVRPAYQAGKNMRKSPGMGWSLGKRPGNSLVAAPMENAAHIFDNEKLMKGLTSTGRSTSFPTNALTIPGRMPAPPPGNHPLNALLARGAYQVGRNPGTSAMAAGGMALMPAFMASEYKGGKNQVFDQAAQNARGMADMQFAHQYSNTNPLMRWGAALMPGMAQKYVQKQMSGMMNNQQG
jgi:hypothetical protein